MNAPEPFTFRPNRCDSRGGPCNLDRAKRAAKALKAYIGRETPDDSHFVDLLGDLMHYADFDQIDFDSELGLARMHHRRER